MSECQYYEFFAVDRPLDTQAQAEVRSLSTRARITATNFINEYHWGNFRGNPSRMMEHYHDAHLCLANWGTRQVTLRRSYDREWWHYTLRDEPCPDTCFDLPTT
ncbi:MAG TPA: hypothetical protein VJ870_12565 [Amycolatopsis sp.]|nr:hypothetical protein [Amycolatopsis sp.]